MGEVFEFLSELWLRFAEKINGIIFSFVFFWGTIAYLVHIQEKICNHLRHLKHATGNHGYFTLQIVLVIVSCVVDFIWFVMPFSITSLIIHGDKADK